MTIRIAERLKHVTVYIYILKWTMFPIYIPLCDVFAIVVDSAMLLAVLSNSPVIFQLCSVSHI